MSSTEDCEQLRRENERREELRRQQRAGRAANDPKWTARDEAHTRAFRSPDGGR